MIGYLKLEEEMRCPNGLFCFVFFVFAAKLTGSSEIGFHGPIDNR